MKTIQLTQGKFALVDDADYEYLNQFSWQFDPGGYAQRAVKTERGWRIIRMHQELTGGLADHADGNGLNNQRHNLRACTRTQNNQNRSVRSDNRSGLKGVTAIGDKWRARIKVDGKTIYLGQFYSKEEAAAQYDFAAKKYFGAFARTNF